MLAVLLAADSDNQSAMLCGTAAGPCVSTERSTWGLQCCVTRSCLGCCVAAVSAVWYEHVQYLRGLALPGQVSRSHRALLNSCWLELRCTVLLIKTVAVCKLALLQAASFAQGGMRACNGV
eukprot:14003-Heterococcus_DN1.PRE.2